MTPAGAILRDEIARHGPIRFHRFMEVALYHPEHGYYRRGRDPFGKEGDYYTAEQLQPTFGLLVSAYLKELFEQSGLGPRPQVVELGAGRGEMAETLAAFDYVPVESGDALPDAIHGAVFANEFFDALPVDVVVKRGNRFHHLRVGFARDDFQWVEAEPVEQHVAAYLEQYVAPCEEGQRVEVNLDALAWMEKIAVHLRRGYLLAIDYGYTRLETVRFPAGTLMSYHRHQASEQVLRDPGEQDITAHVNFSALSGGAAAVGLETVRLESLAQLLLRAGRADQFARLTAGAGEAETRRRRLQLKTLLFGMGETFRALLLRKSRAAAGTGGEKKSDPGTRGRE